MVKFQLPLKGQTFLSMRLEKTRLLKLPVLVPGELIPGSPDIPRAKEFHKQVSWDDLLKEIG